MDWLETKEFLEPCLPQALREELDLLLPGELHEIRIRADRPAVFCTATRTTAVGWTPDRRDVETLAEALSGHSLYARSNETRQGFITLEGGHRMGLSGQTGERNGVRELRSIGSLCIRIAGQWPGSADELLPYAQRDGAARSMLIIGPPGSGKTTLLRDLTRQLAGGSNARQCALIDERGELAACVDGVPQLDVGDWCDVLDGVPKADAFPWLIRSMAPQVIVTDELSGANDVAAVMDAISCGVAVIASVHGASLNDIAARPAMSVLLANRCFSWYVVLGREGCGHISAIYDRAGSPVKRS